MPPVPRDTPPLNAVFVRSNGVPRRRWRAADRGGNVRAIPAPGAARHGGDLVPAHAAPGSRIRAASGAPAARRFANRAEQAHQPPRERERCMSPWRARHFLVAYGSLIGHSRPRRHRLTAVAYRRTRDERCAALRATTATPAPA